MSKRRLPIGIQTFREVRDENCYYVDKTAYIRRLLDEGKHYLLSRPRRFGKSLFLDTLKELFEGNEPLFVGLHIHDHWDWSVRHPVLRLDFSRNYFKEPVSGPQILDHFRCEIAGSRRADSLGLGQIHRVFYIQGYYGVVAGCTGADSPPRRHGLRRPKRRFLA